VPSSVWKNERIEMAGGERLSCWLSKSLASFEMGALAVVVGGLNRGVTGKGADNKV